MGADSGIVMTYDDYPTLDAVNGADKAQLHAWYAGLPGAFTAHHTLVLRRIRERIHALDKHITDIPESTSPPPGSRGPRP